MTCATLQYIFMTVSTWLTTNTVIIFLIIFWSILLSPHKLTHMRPRSIGQIPSLSPDTKLRQVQQNTDMLVQIPGRTHPHIADNLPMPKACKEVFQPLAIETMHIIIFLLVVPQFLTTNEWHGSMDAAVVGAIIHGGPQQRGQNQKKLPHPYLLRGPKEGGSAM